MRRRVVGFVAALVLAALGTTMLVAYVGNAEDRALAGEELVEILVVDERIAEGTPSENMADSIRVEQVPVKVRVADAIAELEDVEELVASIDLLPGEQLTRRRFVPPEALTLFVESTVEVPDNHLEVTIAVEPQRALGGLRDITGKSVTVIASFEPFDYTAPPGLDGEVQTIEIDGNIVPAGGKTPNATHAILHDVLITKVDWERLPEANDTRSTSDDTAEIDLIEAPNGRLLVTLALPVEGVERLIFTQEFGRVWLALETEDDEDEPSAIETRSTIFRVVGNPLTVGE